MKNWIITIAVIVVLGGAAAWFLLDKKNSTQSASATVRVQTTTARKGKLEVAVSGSGSVTAPSDEDVTAANTRLVIDSISVAAGDTVSKGDTLVTFKNGDVVTAPYDGEISSVSVKDGYGASQGTILLRMENEDGVKAPITRRDAGENSNRSSSAGNLTVDTVNVKEGQTVKADATLASFTDGSILQAPVSGTITSLDMKSGDSVQASAKVAHITDYKSLQTTISVDELDIPKVKAGQAVKITASAFPNETFKGKVTKVAKQGDSSNGVSTFDVTVKITDPKSLKVGMSTEASISIQGKNDALYVPVEAVYKSNNEKYVLVPSSSDDSGQSGQKVTVKTGMANDTNVEITSGLKEGDMVQIPRVKSNSNSFQGQMMQGGQFGGGKRSGGFQGGGFQGSGFRPSGGQGGKE